MAEPTTIGLILWILAITASLAGVQFVYSIQFAVGNPLFVDQLHVPNSISGYILATAGPISGFIVQPVIGVISDTCTSRFGRRRPFIFVGILCCAVGMLLIGNSYMIGNALGDKKNGDTQHDHTFALAFAIIGLWIMNLFVNVIQGPARAIIADIVPPSKQQLGNAMVSNVMGLAAITANVVGAQFFGRPQPYRYLFLIGVGFIILSAIPTLLFAREKSLGESQGNINEFSAPKEKVSILFVFVKIYRAFRDMPGTMARVTLLFFFSWAAFSPFMIWITGFFGKDIYGGDPDTDPDKFQQGVKMGMYGLAIFAAVQWTFSFFLPTFIRLTSVKIAYLITQIIATGCYIMFLFFDQVWVAFLLMAGISLNFTTFNSIPFALVTASFKDTKDVGLYMGVLNSASVVSQTVTNLIAGTIVRAKDEEVKYGIAFGGALSIVACLCVFLVQVPKDSREDNERTPLLKDEKSPS